MKVFVFDLVPYAKHFEKIVEHGRLPYPMTRKHFEPKVAVATYREHLEAWVELERLGYDGVAFNEHHATPYGLMNSPNLLAASVAQRTSKLKLLMYGNLLPLHDPLRLAEEIAMLDCLSDGRIICGVARGAPREYRILNVPLDESRARFDEVYEIMRRAWTEESFSFDGKFYHYKNIACWPRPVQQPHPPVWIPITSSKDSIEWAAANDACITPGMPGPSREDTIRYYAECLAKRGKRVTPDHLNIMVEAYVADSKQQAVEEYAPYALYFHTLFNYDHVPMSTVGGYFQKGSADHLRQELRATAHDDSARLRETTMEDILRQAEMSAWGTPKEVADKIIAEAEAAGAGTVLVNMNRGALPQEMFLRQIRRFGEEVLPRLQAHGINRVPLAEAAAA
jgi:alkanesulfonate monooxygenase SsuD/methylene tetrahydromethanopterin reductase-like flavin-dependent oxidoreductase (luciferase family)